MLFRFDRYSGFSFSSLFKGYRVDHTAISLTDVFFYKEKRKLVFFSFPERILVPQLKIQMTNYYPTFSTKLQGITSRLDLFLLMIQVYEQLLVLTRQIPILTILGSENLCRETDTVLLHLTKIIVCQNPAVILADVVELLLQDLVPKNKINIFYTVQLVAIYNLFRIIKN